jgi:outer membrane lipoprotein carrier protein
MQRFRKSVRTVSICLMSALAITASSSVEALPVPQDVPSGRVQPPATDLAAELQRRYDRVKDFSASFTQTYEGGVLRRKAVESGTLHVKKPGRMRWDYAAPQKKVFVSDGTSMFMYFPEDRQVMTYPVPKEDEATSAILFLMGRGNLTRDFQIRYADRHAASEHYVLRLDPKIRQTEYDWLELEVDRETLQIRTLTAGDAQGGHSTFAFANIKENLGLADKMFQFSIPRGTEVIAGGKTP